MDDCVIRFEHFGFQYNAQSEPTLYDICLEVRKGERILIAGPSGSGKSTIAHCINGLAPFSFRGEITGSLTVCGRETRDLGLFEISRHVGTVLQDTDGQFIGLTVAEDIAFALENECVGEPELHSRVEAAARMVGIGNHLSHSPNELSGGQRQRAAMAGIMVNQVDVLLFDEPLANLDPATGKTAIELIDQLQTETGAAVIIIEHRLEDVLHRPVDRIVLMNEGRILADLSPDELLSSDLLVKTGIREPLYIPALRYAGVSVTSEMRPASIRTLTLSDAERARVRAWYQRTPAPERPSEMPLLLEAEHITFAYDNGVQALKDITIRIHKGELTAIAGTNGAGKSTFSKVICGFETQQTGTLRFDSVDMSGLSIKERADRIGYVMQDPNQMISKNMIFDEVALGLRTRNVPEAEIGPRVEQALRVCELWPFRNWPVAALSFGQKKRVTIASILVLEPQMIILDEPTAGQDYQRYTEIMSFLQTLNSHGVTVLMITHDMHLMLEYAGRVLVFSDGHLIADDDGATVLTNPELVRRASLKETSLYDLAVMCGIEDASDFVRRFIDYERREGRK